MSFYKMSFEKFDELEKQLREFPCPVNIDVFTPDLDKIQKASQSDKQYVLFLIWYQSTVPLNEFTRKCHERVWDEINDRVLLY